MLGSALYYPYIDIPDPKWLRSAVLFWDEIKTIAPRSIKDPYRGSDTRILWQEGFLEPLRCDLHPELLDTLGKRVVGLMDRELGRYGSQINLFNTDDPNAEALFHADRAGEKIYDQFQSVCIHPEKMSLELRDLAMRAGLARMHPGKISPRLQGLLREIERVSWEGEEMPPSARRGSRQAEDRAEWLLVNNRFAEIYMSALAALLAKETELAALTDEEPSMGVNLHTLLEDVKPSSESDKKGALVSFVMESISISPVARIDKLLAFRRSHQNQIAELSAQFSDISSKITSCENRRELEDRVRIAYMTKIRPKLESLKSELDDNSIQAAWDGIQRAVTVSVPAGGALSYFSGLTGTTLLAAGAAIAVADISVKTHLARKKARRASPYTYLLDVRRKFSVQNQ